MQLALQTRGSFEEVLLATRFAEERGLAALALPDHYLAGSGEDGLRAPASDALIHLAGLARETETIELVVLVSPITFRHPAVHLKQAVDINIMSGGRFSLGLGTGWLDEEHEVFGISYPDISERFERLEEALGYITAALADQPTAFEGKYFRLNEFDIHPSRPGTSRSSSAALARRKRPGWPGSMATSSTYTPNRSPR